MEKFGLFSAVVAAATLTAGVALAQQADMEKCMPVGKDGKSLIKAQKADCKSTSHSCAGQNKAGDAESWIMVPKGQCDKIKAGDMSGLSKELKDKLEMAAPTPAKVDGK